MSEIQSRAKATISLHRINKINPTAFQWAQGSAAGVTATLQPSNTITFNSPTKAVLTITNDGDVIWGGKPSEASKILVTSFGFAVENQQGITKAARRRYYLRACQNILNKAESMEHQEFLDFLKKHVYNKERRVIMDNLRGEE